MKRTPNEIFGLRVNMGCTINGQRDFQLPSIKRALAVTWIGGGLFNAFE